MKQILGRLVLTIPVVWLVVSLVFLLIHLVPGDPILEMLGEGATPADIDALRHQYGLDQPLWKQYLHYWNGVVHGNLGDSIRLHDTVAHLVAHCRTSLALDRCPPSLSSPTRERATRSLSRNVHDAPAANAIATLSIDAFISVLPGNPNERRSAPIYASAVPRDECRK